MQNLMNDYIKIVKSNMNKFMKIFLDNKYVKSISDEFIETYTETRYYGLIEIKKGFTVKNKILNDLREKREELLEEFSEKEKIIDLTYAFLDSCIALNETSLDLLDEEIEQVVKLRKIHFSKDDDNDYKNEIRKLVKDSMKEKENLLKKTNSEKFFLKYSNYKITNLKKVIVKHNIKFPAVYSKQAIDKIFNNSVVAEDKVFVEYNMISAQVIRDIENAIYRKQYVVEFPETILDKTQKMARLLEIINHPSIQDRLMLNISYKTIIKYRDKIYELLRNGYKIALTLDDSFEGNAADIQRLSLFQYVLVNKKSEYYNQLVKNKLKNLVEI